MVISGWCLNILSVLSIVCVRLYVGMFTSSLLCTMYVSAAFGVINDDVDVEKSEM